MIMFINNLISYSPCFLQIIIYFLFIERLLLTACHKQNTFLTAHNVNQMAMKSFPKKVTKQNWGYEMPFSTTSHS